MFGERIEAKEDPSKWLELVTWPAQNFFLEIKHISNLIFLDCELGQAWGGEGRDLKGPFLFWERVGAKGVSFYRMGPFMSKGSSPLRSKFTISWPFFTVNVVGGERGTEGRGVKVTPFVPGTCASKGGHFFSHLVLPIRIYSRLTEKNGDFTKRGSQPWGADGSCKVELNFRSE